MEEENKQVEISTKFKSIVESIDGLSVLELNELVKIFEEKYGVSASAAVAVAGDAGGDSDDDESGTVSVSLDETGEKKIQVIKVIKEVLALGLKEAKDFTEETPKIVKEGLTQEEAKEIEAKLKEAGAKVSIK